MRQSPALSPWNFQQPRFGDGEGRLSRLAAAFVQAHTRRGTTTQAMHHEIECVNPTWLGPFARGWERYSMYTCLRPSEHRIMKREAGS